METEQKETIIVQNTVDATIEKVWDYWTKPEHITQWNNASDDWHTPQAENDLRTGGSFNYTMAAKDGSFSFDFGGTYNVVTQHSYIEFTIGDGRKVKINFENNGNSTTVSESFEAENVNPIEMQRSGWQAILDNFKKYTENN
mgnify:CR=1 FL=1